MISKIIHQIWWQGENKVPDTYPDYRHTWKENHKDFKYMFWDEKKIKNLINKYPQYKKMFYSMPKMIHKIDMAKYIILHHYGGLYVDMDSECFKSIEDILFKNEIMLVQINVNLMEKVIAYGQLTGVVLQNGVMGGKKGHNFWLHCLDTMKKVDFKKYIYETDLKYTFRTTGPGLLTSAYYSYPNKKIFNIVSHEKIDPVSWCDYEEYDCHNKSCKKHYPDSYSIHHFGSKSSDSWVDGDLEKQFGLYYCKRKSTFNALLCIILLIVIYYVYKRWCTN